MRRSRFLIRLASMKCIPRHRMHSTTSSIGALRTAFQSIRSRVEGGRGLGSGVSSAAAASAASSSRTICVFVFFFARG
eukprot:30980-Pelagococcus_subviridis.AAC.1